MTDDREAEVAALRERRADLHRQYLAAKPSEREALWLLIRENDRAEDRLAADPDLTSKVAAAVHGPDPFPHESRASLIHRIELLTVDLAAAEARVAAIPGPALDERLREAAERYVATRDAYIACNDDESEEPCGHWYDQHEAYADVCAALEGR